MLHLLAKFEKFKTRNGEFEQLVENYQEGLYKDGKMHGKRGWKDGDLQLLGDGTDLAEHAESKKIVVDSLLDIFGNKFTKILENPVAKALVVFDHRLWTGLSPKDLAQYGHSEIKFLISHYSKFFDAAEAEDCLEQWDRLKLKVTGSDRLKNMAFGDLWPLLISQYTDNFEVIPERPRLSVGRELPARGHGGLVGLGLQVARLLG